MYPVGHVGSLGRHGLKRHMQIHSKGPLNKAVDDRYRHQPPIPHIINGDRCDWGFYPSKEMVSDKKAERLRL